MEDTPETIERRAFREDRITSDTVCSASVLCMDEDPDSFIRGMNGVQWTAGDLEFIKRSKQEKQVKRLQEELFDLLRLKSDKIHTKKQYLARREKIQAELDKTPSCEHLGRFFLSKTQSTARVEDLDSKSLLAQINAADVQYAILNENIEFTKLKATVGRAQKFRDEEKKLIENRNMELTTNINRLMRELSELKSKLPETKEISQVDTVLRRSKRIAAKREPQPILKKTVKK